MKKIISLTAVVLSLASLIPAAHTQVLLPGYSGINRVTLPGNSDTIIATPFARPPAVTSQVLSSTPDTVTFKGSQAWATNQYVFAAGTQENTYYLLITSGTKAGAWFTITANTSATVTVDLDGETLTGLAANDGLALIPYWTLGTVFPEGQGVHISSTPGNLVSEVWLPSSTSTGINASLDRKFYFHGGFWKEIGQGTTNRNNEILYPDTFFTVRHNIATATEFLNGGSVLSNNLKTPLLTSSTGRRDNYLGIQRAEAFSLADSGLISSGAFSTSPSPGTRTDELYVYDNVTARTNKAPSATYYYWNSAWRKVGAGTTSFDTAKVFTPGAGFIIRKNLAATPGPTPVWTNSAAY